MPKFPATVISSTQNSENAYGSVCLKDANGKIWIGHGGTYLANSLINDYRKGDTIK